MEIRISHRFASQEAIAILAVGFMLVGCGRSEPSPRANVAPTGNESESAEQLISERTSTSENVAAVEREAVEPADVAASIGGDLAPEGSSGRVSPGAPSPMTADVGVDVDTNGLREAVPSGQGLVKTADSDGVKPVEAAEEDSPPGGKVVMTSATKIADATTNSSASKSSGTEEGYPEAYFEQPRLVREGPESAVRVSFDDVDLLKIMGLDPVPADVGPQLPPRIRDLDGRRIRLRGFMYPPFATEGLTGFVLARDNEICCFGRSPKIYDLVPVELRSGVTTRYIEGRPFDVVGVLHVEPDADEDELFQFLYMNDAIVIE